MCTQKSEKVLFNTPAGHGGKSFNMKSGILCPVCLGPIQNSEHITQQINKQIH